MDANIAKKLYAMKDSIDLPMTEVPETEALEPGTENAPVLRPGYFSGYRTVNGQTEKVYTKIDENALHANMGERQYLLMAQRTKDTAIIRAIVVTIFIVNLINAIFTWLASCVH